jgi:hypothetical protein
MLPVHAQMSVYEFQLEVDRWLTLGGKQRIQDDREDFNTLKTEVTAINMGCNYTVTFDFGMFCVAQLIF